MLVARVERLEGLLLQGQFGLFAVIGEGHRYHCLVTEHAVLILVPQVKVSRSGSTTSR